MQYDHITTDEQLAEYCQSLDGAKTICFDTEFISEHTFRPELCLVQVAVGDRLAVIDPLSINDMTPFWKRLTAAGHETIAHAGREELNFCHRSVERGPADFFDIQIAAGLVGSDYPAGYGTLLSRYLGKKLSKHETRTDWKKRPLSDKQMQYALDDVIYLEEMRNILFDKLQQKGRSEWLAVEMAAWQEETVAILTRERWRRLSGASNLAPRALAIARELWRWRNKEAERRNSPVKRVLRDDLIVELSKRQSSDPRQIQLVRGFERSDLRRAIPELAECVGRAMKLSDDECPRTMRRDIPSQLNLVAQLLAAILTSICRASEVAVGLVGSVQDIRELVAHRLSVKGFKEELPKLSQGWRAEVVGQVIDDILSGKTSIRVGDPLIKRATGDRGD